MHVLSMANMEGLKVGRPSVVLGPGKPGSWDSFGVRDPSILVDDSGRVAYEGGAMVMYYTGSSHKGIRQCIGRAVSFDEGRSWTRSPQEPVLSPSESGWDSGLASTPWAIRDDEGRYRLYYRGAKGVNKDEAIGLAISRDGISFERYGEKPVLSAGDFADIPKKGRMFMGVVNVVRTLEGRYLLTFEGSSVKHGLLAQIFGAISDDGISFTPLNSGYPIFTAFDVRSWPVNMVANPRITVPEDKGIYMLTFNGCHDDGLYSIGAAFTRNFKEWREHPGNPLIAPANGPADDPFSGRIEGGVFIKEDIEKERDPIRIFLMGIPRRGPSHKDGVIGLAFGHLGKIKKEDADKCQAYEKNRRI